MDLGPGRRPMIPLSKNISKKGPQISPLRCAPVEMTKGKAVPPSTVVVEQEPFFITLGGPGLLRNKSVFRGRLRGEI